MAENDACTENMTEITSKNFKKICRLCLEEGNLVPIRETLVEDLQVSYLLEYCVSLEVTEVDSTPPNICDNCLTDLYTIYGFKKRCHENDRILRQFRFDGIENGEELIKIEVVECDNVDLGKIEKVEVKEYDGDGENCDETERKELSFECSTCKQCFSSAKASLDHQKEESHAQFAKIFCEICGETYVYRRKAKHMKMHGREKKPKCYVCNRTFSDKSNLKRHLMKHTGERPFVCSTCGKGFNQKTVLINHERLHQLPLESHQCEHCNRIFSKKFFLEKHMQSHYLTEDSQGVPFIIQDDEKAYMCEICSMKFTHYYTLKSHYLTHDAPQFLCSYCGKVFARKLNLDLHKMVHTGERPYKCTFCSSAFRQRQHLTLHIRTHTGERPFECPYCDKAFAFKGNLKVHVRIHTGERPYKCDDCGKGFHHLTAMKKHRVLHRKSSLERFSLQHDEEEEEEQMEEEDNKSVEVENSNFYYEEH